MEGKTRGGDESRKYVSYVCGGEEKKRKGKEKMTKEKVQWLNKARLQSPRLLSFSLPPPSFFPLSPRCIHARSEFEIANIPFRREKFQLLGKEGSVAGSSRGAGLENDIINEPIESI